MDVRGGGGCFRYLVSNVIGVFVGILLRVVLVILSVDRFVFGRFSVCR